ncbi:MAG TPA: TonB-dependent receptor [Burkholderiales bacterium]|nr:TonB-dependent receptor [Burkholderiales bacterium]
MTAGRNGRNSLLAAAMLAAGPAFAADAPPAEGLSEQEFLREVPVVLSASRLRQPLDQAPAAITVIDREMIEASGAREIPELFRMVPGFVVGHVVGHDGVVGYHGLTDNFPRRIQVLVDGRSIYSLANIGGVDWSALPLALEDIDRIEVTRGPNSVSYGANAFLGVVNIYTRYPTQDLGLQVSVSQGEEGIADRFIRYAGTRDGLDYRISLASRRDHGFDEVNDSQKLTFANARAEYRLDPKNTLGVEAGLSDGNQGIGEPDNILDPIRDSEVESNFVQLYWRRVLDGDAELFVQYYRNFDKVRDNFSVTAPPPFPPLVEPINRDKTSTRDNIEFQHTFAPAESLRFAWGSEARWERVESPGLLGTEATQKNSFWRVFGNAEWRPAPAWLVNAGLMYEDNQLGGSMLSPRLALNYTIAPGHTVRAGVTRGYRTPNLFEEKADVKVSLNGILIDQDILARGGLKPESILAREIAYLGEFSSLRMSVDARVFRESIQDLIGEHQEKLPPGFEQVFPFSFFNDAFNFTNNHWANITGAELQVNWSPFSTTRLVLSAANMDLDASDINDDFFVKNPNRPTYARSAPRNSMSLLAIQRLPGRVQFSALYSYYDEMDWLGSDRVPSYNRLDLRLAHKFKGSWGSGEAAVVYQNLTPAYTDFAEENTFDRRAYFTLKLNF